MLPSFRLIAATFLCGFLAVFAGMRLTASLHGVHGALPAMTAHAAPMPIVAIGGQELRHGQNLRDRPAAIPVMYDLRFVVSASSLAPIAEGMTARAIDRAAPVALPLVITPPLHDDGDREQGPATAASEPEPAEPRASVAAINPEAAVEAASAISPLVIATPAEQPQPEPPAAADTD